MADEVQLMADGCAALMRLVYGENNWLRWNDVKQRSQLDGTQSFLSWLLDLADVNLEAMGTEHDMYMTTDSIVSQENIDLPSQESEPVYSTNPKFISDVITLDGGEQDIKIEPPTQHPSTSFNSSALDDEPQLASDPNAPQVEIVCKADKKSFYCNECNVTLNELQTVKEHVSLRHTNYYLVISCFCCNQKFSSFRDYVSYHKQYAVMKDPKALVCDYCADAFKWKTQLEEHINNKHLKTGPKHECSACHKKFSYKRGLTSHMKICMLRN